MICIHLCLVLSAYLLLMCKLAYAIFNLTHGYARNLSLLVVRTIPPPCVALTHPPLPPHLLVAALQYLHYMAAVNARLAEGGTARDVCLHHYTRRWEGQVKDCLHVGRAG